MLHRLSTTTRTLRHTTAGARMLRHAVPGTRTLRHILPLAVVMLCSGIGMQAGEVVMKSGFHIGGRPLPIEGVDLATAAASRGNTRIEHIWMIDDGMRRYLVPQRQVPRESVDRSSLVPFDEYSIRHEKSGRGLGPSIVGSFSSVAPFDEYGRRLVTLEGGQQGNIPVHQGISKLRPDYVIVEATNLNWEYGLSTWTIPPDVIGSLLKQATDPNDPKQRLGIVRFYIDAEMYSAAQAELASILATFPDRKDQIEQTQQELAHYIAVKALNEIRRRQAAGQHRLAFAVANGFPQNMVSADLRREAKDLADEYRRQFDAMARAQMLLGLLEADLTPEQAAEVRPLRSVISDQLTIDTLPRLEPFLRSEQDDTLNADEKLALAYSGWLRGPALAELSLSSAVRLWQMRFLTLQYLRTEDELARRDILRDLHDVDGATVATLASMIPQLTPSVDEPPPQPGVPMSVELIGGSAEVSPVRYSVSLPLEYSPLRRYPLIVALHGRGMTREHELTWWAGTAAEPGHAMKHGYIVIAPEYADADDREYNYDLRAHTTVVAALTDARKRFSVDSNRIFLGGHGMGGDAAFDIGMAQSDLFAGVIPITATAEKYCKWTWPNSKLTGWYVIGGERDRNTLEINAPILNNMMKRGYDVVLCEYMKRGYETYFEELPRLFDWMQLHQRPTDQERFEANVLRPTGTDWYWLATDEYRDDVLQPVVWEPGAKAPRPQNLEGIITPGNTIIVNSGGRRTTIRLSPDLINFDERVEVKISGRTLYRGFVKPEIESLLEDLRQRGDRERLYWAKLEY